MKADEKLDELGVEYTKIIQDQPTHACDAAAKARGVEESHIAKSLIIEQDEEVFHCVIPGNRTLSASKFGEYRLVDPEKSEELTGQESGTVHPFSTDLEHFIDRKLLNSEVVSFTTGDSEEGLILEPEKFREALEKAGFDFETGDIVKTTEEDIEALKDQGLSEEKARFVISNRFKQEFEELSQNAEKEMAVHLLEEFKRHGLEYSQEVAEEILSRAEKETHMQKLVKAFDREGELPEKKEFSLEKEVEKVLDKNSEAVEDYRSGKDSALNYLLGRVMQETNGKADGREARELIEKKLGD
ncbi:MAG: YbaK/EbsC family protein [Candidatus Nanohaloarchaea archaeon]